MARETKTQIMSDFEYIDQIVSSKMVQNNTVEIHLKDGTRIIRHFHTNIVTEKPNGNFVLNTNGWKSYTTKERLNQYAPVRIWQEKGLWYLSSGDYYDKDQTVTNFYDGIELDKDGNLISEVKTIDVKKIEKLKKRIKKFSQKVLTVETLPIPNMGDCLMCRRSIDDKEITDSNEHLWSHMVEGYLHGSLIVNAFKHAGYRDEQIGFHYRMNWRDRIQQVLYKYLRDRIIVHKVERD
jgi:hypothetical protein